MIQHGSVLNNRFQVEELVGSGGMSLIFKGTDLLKHRTVAIKMLREQFVNDPQFIARFRREGQAVAGLSHPNIVKIYSVCQDEDVYYLVLELIEGRDLKQILQNRAKPFEPREIYPIVAQVCDAVNYAHHKNIIHRDIKPHNIIMNHEGQVKVTDFGIARAASEATVTHTGSILGSVHYLSPEQAKGEVADHRSDIYSLGVLLYEMVTGKLPFEGESPISVALQKIQYDPVPPGEANPDARVPEALEHVIRRAMNRNPQRRYQSALQLKDDLREACFNNRLLYADEPEVSAMEDTLDGEALTRVYKANGKANGSDKAVDRAPVDKALGDKARDPGEDDQEEDMSSRKNAAGSGAKAKKGGREVSSKRATRLLQLLRFMIGLALFAGIAIGGISLGGYISSLMYSPSENVQVPVLTGLSEEAAKKRLDEAGLKAHVRDNTVARDNISKGNVAAQDPPASTPVKPGSVVEITLSGGPATRQVPNLLNETQQAATITLNNLGMILGSVETINDEDSLPGVIIRQSPEAGTPLLPGGSVDVVVSLGPVVNMVRTQSFVGMPIDDAQKAAKNLGIELGYTNYEMSWTYPKDMIIKQTPAEGTEMPEGTPIDIVVSLGPGPN